MQNKVLILDFGSQYTQLIARRVRELKVYSEIHPYNYSLDDIKKFNPKAIIFSGGPSSVYEENSPKADKEIINMGVPILGICYGLQLISSFCGMSVIPAKEREFGLAKLEKIEDTVLLQGIENLSTVWMSHGDKISQFPDDFIVSAKTDNTEFAVIESEKRKIYGVQFHPEVVHTKEGKKFLSNFIFNIAGCEADWSMENFIESSIKDIREKTGDEKVILGLSGGVDSTVLAVLLNKAIGDRLYPVFVDTGLLRKNEFNDLMDMFKNKLGIPVRGVDASEIFLEKLKGIDDPEKKRKIIGHTFIEVFDNVKKKLGDVKFLAQGTLYPDVIESVSLKGPAATIKSHHNVGGLPKEMNLTLLEPFRELFKDEVREVGRELELDDIFVKRHPFPGPGLAVRILGDITKEKIKKLQEADSILIEELHNFNIYDEIWQAFVVLLPVKTVGVMGDVRTYENAVAIRLVESVDGMTADWYEAPYDFLKKVSNRIVNEVKGINRVVYDLSSKPPGTIEWE